MTLLLALLLAMPALGQDPDADTAPDPAPAEAGVPEVSADDATIIVYGNRVRAALARLEEKLGSLGYRKAREANGRTTFVGDARWKPAVVVDHDGYLFYQNHPVSFDEIAVQDASVAPTPSGVPVGPEPNANFQTMPPAPTVVAKQTLAEKRTVDALKKRISEDTRPEMDMLREAVYAVGLRQRLADLPAELDSIWNLGRDGEKLLPDADARRAALGALWASRTRTPEGEAVREAVAEFIVAEVQTSDAPFTRDETTHWASVCGCSSGWTGHR